MSNKIVLHSIHNWPYSQNNQWKNLSIDKITFTIHRSFVGNEFVDKHFGSITITKAGEYYRKVHIHSEHINQNELLISQIYRALIILHTAGIIRTGENQVNYLDLFKNINLSELEIAFDMPKRRVNWDILKVYFSQYKNSHYSFDFKKRTKKSLLCFYDRSLKLGYNKPSAEPVYRFEFRFTKQELIKLVPNGDRRLYNCHLFYQKPLDLIHSLEKPMSFYINNLNIPYELFNNYKNHPILEQIMSGSLLSI